MSDSKVNINSIFSKLGRAGKDRKYQEELEIASEQYEAIFEYTGAGMIVIAPDMKILRANHKAAEISGLSLDELEKGSLGRMW